MIVGDRQARIVDEKARAAPGRIGLVAKLGIDKAALGFDLDHRTAHALQGIHGAAHQRLLAVFLGSFHYRAAEGTPLGPCWLRSSRFRFRCGRHSSLRRRAGRGGDHQHHRRGSPLFALPSAAPRQGQRQGRQQRNDAHHTSPVHVSPRLAARTGACATGGHDPHGGVSGPLVRAHYTSPEGRFNGCEPLQGAPMEVLRRLYACSPGRGGVGGPA